MLTILADRRFLGLMALALLTPYAARLPGAAIYGAGWFTGYLAGGIPGALFFAFFNVIPAITLYRLSRTRPDDRISFALAAAVMLAVLAALNGSVDLAADAQSAVVLVIAPILATGVLAAVWVISGLFAWWNARRG